MLSTIVHADSIDKTTIKFQCPYCYTRYKKDGITPYINAKKRIHVHGSCDNLHNRKEHRSSHCDDRIYNGSFEIIIDDGTIRK